MKQIVLFIAFSIAFIAPGLAQPGSYQTLAVTSADSALSASESGYLTATITNNYALLFVATIVRGSGTANGTAYLQGSGDGTTWFTCKTAVISPSITDTMTMTNVATQYARFAVSQGTYGWRYWRVAVVEGGTTGVVSITGKVYFIKPNP